jgi:hypothetical protein
MEEQEILTIAREFNTYLALHDYDWSSCLALYSKIIADVTYHDQPHWHSVQGKCAESVPFEILMQSAALLLSTWVADIFLRKARDRKSKNMGKRYLNWKNSLIDILEHVEREVESHRDIDAEEAFQTGHKDPNKVICFFNRIFFGH